MSIARHHAEWLSLIEISGPFLSLPVLMRVFPTGLDPHDTELAKRVRSAHGEWQESSQNVGIHRAWVEFVLREVLELPREVLRSGQEMPSGLQVTIETQQETLRPDWAIVEPDVPHTPRMLVQMVKPDQDLEKPLKGSKGAMSPATRMIDLLHGTGVRLGLLTNGEQWMLVNAPKGETTGLISWYGTLWVEEQLTLRSFRSLVGVGRFFSVAEDKTLGALLAESATDQQEVTDQLGYQVRQAVEVLVGAIAKLERDNAELEVVAPERLYEAVLTVMMRLVFLFCAEERGLIPSVGTEFYNGNYAVSTLRESLRGYADRHGEEILERRSDAWCRLLATFRAVYGGVDHDVLYLPAYGGSLFDPDRFAFLEGRSAGSHWQEAFGEPLAVNNRVVLHLLEALQLLQIRVPGAGVETRRMSFRALDIEQIGHVYEGLLDHTAVRSLVPVLGLKGTKHDEPEIELTMLEGWFGKPEKDCLKFLKEQTGRSESALKKDLAILPDSKALPPMFLQRLMTVCENDRALYERVLPFVGLIRMDTLGYPVVIGAGMVYVTSGTDRRSSGTHYTPRSLTEEIVKYTLEPLVYVGPAEGAMREDWRLRSAADLLGLKVCDIAMGSGAFLVQVCRYLAERVVEAWNGEMMRNPPLPPAPSPTRGEGEPESLALVTRSERGIGGDKWEVPEVLKQKMVEVARQFRKEPTASEAIVWQALRGKKLDDRKFRRQQPIGPFVVDFFCAAERLIVEVDGAIHEMQKDRDRERQELIESLGLRFIRVSSELVETDLAGVLERIRAAFRVNPPLPPIPSPTGGERESESVDPPSSLTPSLAPLSRSGRGAGGEGDYASNDRKIRVLPDGSLSLGEIGEDILPDDAEERLVLARRLVADRCLYGVDKNPLAVEMAKLSLWLITLAKGRPFTFVDHALKAGDSLLGLTDARQIEYLHLNPDNEVVQYPIAAQIWQPILQDAIAKRMQLESFGVNGIGDLRQKERLFTEAERLIDRLRFVGDYLVARALADAGKRADLTTEELMVVSQRIEKELAGTITEKESLEITALKSSTERMMNLGNPVGQKPRKPFHWLLEFPEVFLAGNPPLPPAPSPTGGEREPEQSLSSSLAPFSRSGRGVGGEGLSGFDAIVGNPPFQGGQKITGAVGTDYRNFLVEYLANGQRGSADLCAYFFLQADRITNSTGSYGLVATNTIAQGDTREVGLDQIAQKNVIYRAVPSRPWIGVANLEVGYVWIGKQKWEGEYVLNDNVVSGITSFLTLPGKSLGNPHKLIANQNKSFQGSIVLGMGFVLTHEEAEALIAKDPKNKDVLFPYLNGEDLNSRPDQSPSRWVINFKDWPLDAEHDNPKNPKGAPYAADYPDSVDRKVSLTAVNKWL